MYVLNAWDTTAKPPWMVWAPDAPAECKDNAEVAWSFLRVSTAPKVVLAGDPVRPGLPPPSPQGLLVCYTPSADELSNMVVVREHPLYPEHT